MASSKFIKDVILFMLLSIGSYLNALACVPAPNINQNSPNCNSSVQLQAYSSDGSDGNYLYYLYNSSNVKISQNATGIFNVTVGTPTTYYISIYDQDNHCESTKKSISATPGSTPSLSAYGYACTPTSASVFMSGSSGGTYSLILNGTTLASNSTGNFTISNFSTSNQYYASIAVGSCTNQIAISIPLDVIVPSVSGTTNACNGQSVTFTASGASNGAYRWYSDAGLTQLISTNASVSFTASQTTTFYAVNYGQYCTSTAAPITVNVYTPSVPQINSASGFGSVSLSVVSPPANTTYNWYGAASGGSALYTGTNNSFSSTVTYYVSSILNAGTVTCESSRTAVTGTIVSSPTVTQTGLLSSSTNVTLSTTTSYNNYQWLKEGANISGATASTYTATAAGNYSVVVTNNGVQGQGTSPSTFVVFHVAPPAVNQSSPNCNTVNAQAYTSDGSVGSYTYKLFNSSQALITSNTTGLFPLSISTPTAYFVSIYDSYNNYETTKTSFTATPAAAPSLSAYAYSCAAGAAVAVMSGSAGNTYSLLQYDGASYLTLSSNTTGNFNFSTNSNYQYYSKATLNGCSTQQLLSIPQDVTVPSVSGTTNACNGQSVTFTASGASNGAYRWYSDAGLTQLASQSSSITFTATQNTTRYAINYGQYCTSTPASITVNVYTPTVPQINSASGFGSVSLSVISQPASTTYNWYGAASGGSALYTGTSNLFSSTGTYYVSAILNPGTVTCESSRTVVTGTIVSPPTVTQTGLLSSTTNVTLSTTSSYSTYQWTKEGANISGATASTYTATAAGNYGVNVTNSGVQGQGTSSSTFVVYHVEPPAISQSSPNCTTVNIQAYTSDGSEGSYIYKLFDSSQALITSNTTGIFPLSISVPTSYFVSIYDSYNNYETTKTSFTATPAVAPSLSAYAYSCVVGTAVAVMSGSAGNTYSLLQYDGASYLTLSSNSTGNFSFSTNASYQYYAKATLNGCTKQQLLTITPDYVTTPTVTGPTQICAGQTVSLVATAANSSFAWYDDAGLTHQVGTTASFTPSNSQTKIYYVVNTGIYCKSATATVTENVNTPVLPTINPATAFIQATLSVNSPQANTNYNWYDVNTGGIALYIGASHTFTSSGTYYVSAVLTNGSLVCESSRTTATVSITPPSVSYLSYGYSQTLSAGGSYYSYQWYKDGSAIPGATQSTYTTTVPGLYTLMTQQTVNSTAQIVAAINVIKPSGQQDGVNIASRTILYKAGQSASTSLFTLQPTDLVQSLVYGDGLARPVQQVAIGQAVGQGDVIATSVYGKNGLTDSTFLPYTTTSVQGRFHKNAVRGNTANNSYATSEQYAFYQSTAKVAVDSNPYARVIYRNTPDARVTEQGAVGSDWQPGGNHTQRVQLTLSTASNFPVRLWKTDGTTAGNYPDRSVSVKVVTDENNHQVRIYTDPRGLTVLKQVQSDASTWLETYYIYDDYGQLIYQLPPKAMTTLGTGASLNAANSSVAELVYTYSYDTLGRLVQKKVPGAAFQSYAYDQLDRVVLIQDGNLRSKSQWSFVKYDVKNRPVYSGVINSTTDRATWQTQFNAINYSTQPYYETEAVNATYQGYTNTVFPTTGLTVLAVNYYDHYDFDRNGTADYTYDNTHLSGLPSTASTATRGLSTGSKKQIIGTSNWLVKVAFYDNLDRALQVQSNNHLNLLVQDKVSVLYYANDLSGHVQKTLATHTGATTVNVLQRYSYDNAWRTTGIYHTINSGVEQQVAAYQYNALGQVVTKQLHSTGGTFMQNVDLRYNIRGWLTSINNAQLTSDGGVTNNDTNDYFGLELFYNKVESSGLNNGQNYNGNISAMKWKTTGSAAGATGQRSYNYNYDYSDRLLSANFKANSGSAWNLEANTLNETMTYDANGNIATLLRNQNQRGLSGTTVTSSVQTIDNLTYTYATGNQLSKVEDASSNTRGFNNGANNATEYTYETNGSLIKDDNKGISTISYNVLGKPQQITYTNGTTIVYTYDAGGTKLKTVTTVGGVTTTIDYVNSFVYNNNALSFFSSPEGRVVKNGSNYEYQYAITDHQGNTRVLFTSAAQSAQSMTATFESANQTTEATQFSNYGHISAVANHTTGGTNSQYLNGGYAGMVGVARSYKVFPGDQLKIEAYGSYNAPGGSSSNLGSFAGALLTALSLPTPAIGETGTASAGINTWGGIEAAGFGDGSTDNIDPKAFVNIILFDKNYNFLDVAYAQLKGTSLYYMSASYTIKEAGYAYLYVSNEQANMTDVYFDDVKMMYTPGNILQSNEYYPFGLQTANSWTRDNTTANNFLANGGTEFNPASALYDLEFRNYDPVLGRLHQVDPLAEKYSSYTPYNFSLNNPVLLSDPRGLQPITLKVVDISGSGNGIKVIDGGGSSGTGPVDGTDPKTGTPRYDGNGGYYRDENENGRRDVGEESASFAEVHDYYRSSFQSTPSLDAYAYGQRTYKDGVLIDDTVLGYNLRVKGGSRSALAASIPLAISTSEFVPVALTILATAAVIDIYNNRDAIANGINSAAQWLSKGFKGGKQSVRDRDYGLPPELFDWWHNGGGKRQNGGEDIGYDEGQISPEDVLEQWEGLGKPRGSKSKEK